MPQKSDQPSWVKEFRKAVKASTPKGWLVMQGKKESTRVQIRKDGKKIADITIPYAWKESDWPDALMRVKAAAKAYEESEQKLDLKTCFNIAHTVSSENEINWEESIQAYREFKKNRVKDSTWRSKYDPVLTNVIKAMKSRVKTPKNGPALVKVALKQWQEGTTQRRHMRLALYGLLRFLVQEQKLESTWLPPSVTDKDLVTTKKRIGYPLTDAQILRLLDSFPIDDVGNKWRFAFQCMAVYGLRPEDLRHIHTRNGGQEMWSNYEKSKGGKKGNKTEPRRLYPLLVHDIDGPISWHLKEQLHICEQEGRSMIPTLGKEGNAAAACKTYLSRRKVWDAIKKEIAKEKQELTPYSFRHRYAYYGHNRPKADGSYRAPKQIADAMGHTLDTHLLSYSRFQTKDLASAFDETSLLVKAAT
ncbi:integrase [Prochlorococcus sp. MIT 1011]|uniref:integrase n=1 Tax=Prochlorococcus sp. MIT 1011 TaxID=3082520 RepID=UPI0039B5E370